MMFLPMYLGGFIVEFKNGKKYEVDFGNIGTCSSQH